VADLRSNSTAIPARSGRSKRSSGSASDACWCRGRIGCGKSVTARAIACGFSIVMFDHRRRVTLDPGTPRTGPDRLLPRVYCIDRAPSVLEDRRSGTTYGGSRLPRRGGGQSCSSGVPGSQSHTSGGDRTITIENRKHGARGHVLPQPDSPRHQHASRRRSRLTASSARTVPVWREFDRQIAPERLAPRC